MTSSAVEVTDGRELLLRARAVAAIMGLSLAHFVGYMICRTQELFTGAWFPFRWRALPENAVWQLAGDILGFPLLTISKVVGEVDVILHPGLVVLNSLICGLGLYLIFSRLVLLPKM